jgi:hypothetical protein
MKAKHVNQIMSDMFRRYPTPREARESRIAARNKHMQKICLILDIEYKPIVANEKP